jgi:predicted amidophosphoribosyltransferase
VIDDVRTTGATLAEVSSWLRWLGATRVDAGVLSVAS